MRSLLLWLARRRLRHLHVLGAIAGWLTWLGSPSYRRRLHTNATLAGVEAAPRRASVAAAGRMVLELPRVWLRPAAQPIPEPVRWEGGDLVEAALAQPAGLLLLTPHMGSFEIAAQSYAERYGPRRPITVLYRPARQAWLRELEATARARPHMATAPASLAGVRQLLRALRSGQTVGLLPDQVPPEGQGVWAPFFGQPAYTMTLAARLAQQTGAAVLVLWCERLPRGAGYVVRTSALTEPLALPASDAVDAVGAMAATDDAARQLHAASVINRAMQTLILEHPAQYLWGYHRYKQPRRGPA